VEDVDGVSSELSAQGQWNADQGRVGQRGTNGKVGPSVAETFHRRSPGNVQRVVVDRINSGKSFNEIRRVALVAAKSSPNSVGINCYSQAACGSLRSSRQDLALRLVQNRGYEQLNRFTSSR